MNFGSISVHVFYKDEEFLELFLFIPILSSINQRLFMNQSICNVNYVNHDFRHRIRIMHIRDTYGMYNAYSV